MMTNGFLTLIFFTISTAEAQIFFPSLPVALELTHSGLCRVQSEEYVSNLRNLTLWAYEMIDSSAKSTTGVLRGNQFNLGDFQQCLSARAPFTTQYCLVTLTANVPKPKSNRNQFSTYYDPYGSVLDKLYKYDDPTKKSRNTVKLGWCTPASCGPSEIEEYLNEYLNDVNHPFKEENVSYISEVPEVFCRRSDEERHLDGADISFCVLTLLLIVLVVSATYWDVRYNGRKKATYLTRKMLLAFSARRNFPGLNKREESGTELTALYGIRTFSIFVIIVYHRIAFFMGSSVSNLQHFEEFYTNQWVNFAFHGDMFVDTFFVISGLLVVYKLMSLYERVIINPGLIVLMRYIRLTPVYAFVILYFSTVLYHIGDGPLWKAYAADEVKECRNNWWTNLLYINNYVNAEHMCIVPAWYLPCDFHYFIIALCVVLLIKRNQKLGITAFILVAIVSILVPFCVRYIYETPPFLRFLPGELSNPRLNEHFIMLYTKSHIRGTSYVVGMFAGYLYYRLKGTEYKLSGWRSKVLTLISVCLLLIPLFAVYRYYDPLYLYTALESATYGAIHRILWALGTFGLIFTMSYGSLSFLYKCLSWTCWIPLSKLVYSAYLIHNSLQIRSANVVTTHVQFNAFDVFTYGVSDIVLSFIIALGLYLAIEAPVRIIFKELFFPSRQKCKDMETHVSLQEVKNGNVH